MNFTGENMKFGMIQKINSYFPKISNIKSWLKDIKNGFLILVYLIKLRCPLRFIISQMVILLTLGLVCPVTRLMFGKARSYRICDSFESTFCPSGILSLPFSLKSKIIVPKHISYYLPYLDIYLVDVYRREMLERGMNVIDVGANIGVYTILAAEKVGKNGKVIAIEPEPENYQQLLKNIRLNNFQNVIPVNIALSDHNGLEKLYISHWAGLHSLVSQKGKVSSIEVSTKTVDKLLEELDLKKVDIIKIDTEGAEIPILKGAEKTLKANPNIKIIIAAEHYPSEAKEVCQFLNDRGFETEVSHSGIIMTV